MLSDDAHGCADEVFYLIFRVLHDEKNGGGRDVLAFFELPQFFREAVDAKECERDDDDGRVVSDGHVVPSFFLYRMQEGERLLFEYDPVLFDGGECRLCTVGDVHLAEDACEMVFDRFFTDEELFGDELDFDGDSDFDDDADSDDLEADDVADDEEADDDDSDM